jgi:hypothetical protein
MHKRSLREKRGRTFEESLERNVKSHSYSERDQEFELEERVAAKWDWHKFQGGRGEMHPKISSALKDSPYSID